MDRKTLPSQSLYSNHVKEASRLTCVKGSITVEASLTLPLFLFALMALLYLLEILSLQNTLHAAAHYASRKAMEDSTPFGILSVSKVEENVKKRVGRTPLQQGLLKDGKNSIDCSSSYMLPHTGEGEVVVRCQVRPPIPFFRFGNIQLEEKVRMKAWVGYHPPFTGEEKEGVVYVADTGVVYHKNPNCTYLDLSVHRVSQKSISKLRNKQGGKYHACQKCRRQKGGTGVYITDQGDKYHKNQYCSGLKRTVYTMPLSEAKGLGACSRCGK